MAQSKKAVADSTANTDKQKSKGINIPTDNKSCVKTQFMASDNKKITSTNPYGAGRPALIDKLDQDFLDSLTAYASQSITNMEIAELLDISFTSFYKLMRTSPEFKQAYETGIDNRKYALEKALLKRAEGFTAQETKLETDIDGKVIKKTVTDKTYVPDSTALIFGLKNIYADKYKDRVETINTVNVNVQQIGNMSNEELLQCAGNVEISTDEYNIE